MATLIRIGCASARTSRTKGHSTRHSHAVRILGSRTFDMGNDASRSRRPRSVTLRRSRKDDLSGSSTLRGALPRSAGEEGGVARQIKAGRKSPNSPARRAGCALRPLLRWSVSRQRHVLKSSTFENSSSSWRWRQRRRRRATRPPSRTTLRLALTWRRRLRPILPTVRADRQHIARKDDHRCVVARPQPLARRRAIPGDVSAVRPEPDDRSLWSYRRFLVMA
jgi:hypothetical protein